MADWRGEIDATQQYIATVTGLPLADVTACIERFCQPDPVSRSQAEGGARLVLIDPDRNWGWRVVNIQKYRDKASGKDQVEDGRNTEKVRRYKARKTPADTGGHRSTPTHTQTDTNTKTQNQRPLNNGSSEKPQESAAERVESHEAMQRVLARRS
jgi:hypothetical protein